MPTTKTRKPTPTPPTPPPPPPPPVRTPAETLLAAAEAEQCRRSFVTFARAAWPVLEPGTSLVWNWHLDALCEHLQAVLDGRMHRLLINIAPGHSKSTVVSQMFPAWAWTHDPHLRFLCASTDLSLAIRDNRNCRFLVESDWYRARWGRAFAVNQIAFDMSDDQNIKSFFENDCKGYRQSVSVGSRGIGKRGDLLIIDDPHDPMEGDAQRLDVLEWYKQTWTSRLNDLEQGAMIIVGQRIHDEDLSGYVLSLGGWEHLNLPEEYEAARRCVTSIGWADPRTQAGDLLWPTKFPRAVLDALKKSKGSFGYAAQYQQAPVPASGGQFKREWFRYFERHGDMYLLHTKAGTTKAVSRASCRLRAVNDVAISSKQDADYTVLQIWAVTPDRETLLLAQVRGHLSNPEQLRLLEEQYRRFMWDDVHVETIAYQLALYQQAKQLGIPVKEYRPARDKVARASYAAIRMEAGDTYFERGADYLPDLEDECLKFPKAAHDDQVDCLSMIADLVALPIGPLLWSPDLPDVVERTAEVGPPDGPPHLFLTIDDIRPDEGDVFDFEM